MSKPLNAGWNEFVATGNPHRLINGVIQVRRRKGHIRPCANAAQNRRSWKIIKDMVDKGRLPRSALARYFNAQKIPHNKMVCGTIAIRWDKVIHMPLAQRKAQYELFRWIRVASYSNLMSFVDAIADNSDYHSDVYFSDQWVLIDRYNRLKTKGLTSDQTQLLDHVVRMFFGNPEEFKHTILTHFDNLDQKHDRSVAELIYILPKWLKIMGLENDRDLREFMIRKKFQVGGPEKYFLKNINEDVNGRWEYASSLSLATTYKARFPSKV